MGNSAKKPALFESVGGPRNAADTDSDINASSVRTPTKSSSDRVVSFVSNGGGGGDGEGYPFVIEDGDRYTGSVRSGGSAMSPSVSESLRTNMMRAHTDRDPLFYYEIVQVLGVGSMGSVAKVRKRSGAIGGSARKEIVDTLNKKKREKDCLNIPVVGGLFRFCIDPTAPSSSAGGETTTTTTSGGIFNSTSRNNNNNNSSSDKSPSQSTYELTYALKSIHLNRVDDATFVDELKNEIEILKSLDHPHIVKPMETFYHRNQLFIVMQLCSGGDLYSRDPYTEEEAARITTSILSAVSYMHQNQIVHRDLKYENILFVDNSPQAEIKLIDFGLSKKYAADKELTEGVGTIYTMAPEVLKGTYSSQADLWSIGVIAYMLLSSQMPFYGRKRRHIVEQIMKCKYEFHGRRWKRVSSQAKRFVEDLLVLDPTDRCTAEEALRSTWLNRRFSVTARGPTVEEMDATLDSFEKFVGYSKLKKMALMVIAHKSTSEEIGILRKIFQQYDKEKNGIISFEELKSALERYGYPEDEMQRLFSGLDIDGTGKIRYTEFLAATIEAQGAITEERLAEAFDRLDTDDSGYISAQNLQEMLGQEFPHEEIDAIIKEADLTNDNKISYGEFLALWEDKHEEKRSNFYKEMRQSPFYNQASFAAGLSVSMAEDDKADQQRNSEEERKEMEDDSVRDNGMVGRMNFLEGKKMSERRHHEASCALFDSPTNGESEPPQDEEGSHVVPPSSPADSAYI